jgi:hypothetical protein
VTFSALKGTAGTHAVEQRGKGLNQTFRTRPEHALDVSTYSGAELSYADAQPPARPRFPIVVSLEAVSGGGSGGGARGSAAATPASQVQSQTTFANIVTGSGDGVKNVQPLKQKIQVGATSYELQEIYGIDGSAGGGGGSDAESGASAGGGVEGGDDGRECVICMTEPRDTTVLPCRHMCMCSECAKVLRMQSEKCPICRTPVEQCAPRTRRTLLPRPRPRRAQLRPSPPPHATAQAGRAHAEAVPCGCLGACDACAPTSHPRASERGPQAAADQDQQARRWRGEQRRHRHAGEWHDSLLSLRAGAPEA